MFGNGLLMKFLEIAVVFFLFPVVKCVIVLGEKRLHPSQWVFFFLKKKKKKRDEGVRCDER